MSDEERSKFIAKTIVVGLSAIIGIGFIIEAISSLNDGFANSIIGLFFGGLGVALLINAWKVMGK